MEQSAFTDPDVTLLLDCPACGRMIAFGTLQCPDCREIFDEDYALLSTGLVVLTTQAASQANFLKTLDPGLFLILGTFLFACFLGWWSALLLSLIIPVMSVVAILRWFRRFARFPISDDWYRQAISDMRTSLALWSLLLSLHILVAASWASGWPPPN